MNELRNRPFDLVESLANKTKLGKKIHVTLVSSLPLILSDELVINSKTIKAVTVTQPADADIKNIITDLETPDRLVFIGRTTSQMTGNTVEIYYDNKYNDMFIIPTLDFLHNNKPLNINGYQLGGFDHTINNIELNGMYNISSDIDMPEVNPKLALVNKMVLISGAGKSSILAEAVNNKIVNAGNEVQVNTAKVSTVVTLGLGATVFKTNTKAVAHGIFQDSIVSHALNLLDNKTDTAAHSVSFLLNY